MHELREILAALESQLACPTDAVAVGSAYRQLGEWTWSHQWDEDLAEVLDLLNPESMYPPWRRQALEEAYMLFFEDVAKQGDRAALEVLPEPPTSEELGYRRMPEALVSRGAAQGLLFSHAYEDGSSCCLTRKWDYDIKRTGPALRMPRITAGREGKEANAGGRQIIAKGSSDRCCTCATDPISRLAQVITPSDFCCSRNGKALMSYFTPGTGMSSATVERPYRPLAPTANWPKRPPADGAATSDGETVTYTSFPPPAGEPPAKPTESWSREAGGKSADGRQDGEPGVVEATIPMPKQLLRKPPATI